MRHNRVLMLFIIALCSLLSFAGQASAQEFKYRAKLERMIGDREGELVILQDGVKFETKDHKDELVWTYRDIRLFEIPTPTRARIWSYEDRSWLMLGKDKRFSFKLIDTKFDERAIEFLRSRSDRPFITSFATPETSEQPITEIAVKHLHRFGGCQGVFQVYKDHLAFVTPDSHDSRSWLWSDIQSISRPDQWRLDLLSYEPQTGGPNRSYNFMLKERLTEEVYDQMWSKIYRPTPLIKPDKDVYAKP